ncbi:MAG: GcrA family cell cycle regulator [Alphaproteobacteria bacterium]
MSWTSTRIAKLKKLWEKGLSTTEIGTKLGFSKNAVVGKAHRLGLKSRQATTKKIKRKIAPKISKGAPAKNIRENSSSENKTSIKKSQSKIISILDLKPGMCRWPMEDPRSDEFSFCGEPTFGKKPYCLKHCSQAYTLVAKDKEKKKNDNSKNKSK